MIYIYILLLSAISRYDSLPNHCKPIPEYECVNKVLEGEIKHYLEQLPVPEDTVFWNMKVDKTWEFSGGNKDTYRGLMYGGHAYVPSLGKACLCYGRHIVLLNNVRKCKELFKRVPHKKRKIAIGEGTIPIDQNLLFSLHFSGTRVFKSQSVCDLKAHDFQQGNNALRGNIELIDTSFSSRLPRLELVSEVLDKEIRHYLDQQAMPCDTLFWTLNVNKQEGAGKEPSSAYRFFLERSVCSRPSSGIAYLDYGIHVIVVASEPIKTIFREARNEKRTIILEQHAEPLNCAVPYLWGYFIDNRIYGISSLYDPSLE